MLLSVLKDKYINNLQLADKCATRLFPLILYYFKIYIYTLTEHILNLNYPVIHSLTVILYAGKKECGFTPLIYIAS